MKTRHKAAVDGCEAAIGAEADQQGTHDLLRLLRELEGIQQRHHAALLHLTKGRNHAVRRVLTRCEEP